MVGTRRWAASLPRSGRVPLLAGLRRQSGRRRLGHSRSRGCTESRLQDGVACVEAGDAADIADARMHVMLFAATTAPRCVGVVEATQLLAHQRHTSASIGPQTLGGVLISTVVVN